MSDLRHAATDDDGMAQPAEVLTFARDFRPGETIPPHRHSRDQLAYASHGAMTIQTRVGTWVTPAHRAVWIPAGAEHLIVMSGHVAMRSLYVRPGLAALPSECCVVGVTGLLGSLIAHACQFPALSCAVPREDRLIRFLIDQLEEVPTAPLDLPNPTDPRACRVAAALAAYPADPRPLEQICRQAGTSRRTAERLFLRETGLTIGRWRNQQRLVHALRRLADGAKVIEAAFEAGYNSPSAFTAAFKMTFGTTPMEYLKSGRTD
ncbi:AraC family transcriptional regulator [Sphingomonas mali]|uniref:AraC family transcriptional regulator n=1 Tax=Sphingomonas mali TaxID=40682 RepID=UPI00082A90D1|nr:helix-turn-helix transcriptional regulator [Sphingomonas mali]